MFFSGPETAVIADKYKVSHVSSTVQHAPESTSRNSAACVGARPLHELKRGRSRFRRFLIFAAVTLLMTAGICEVGIRLVNRVRIGRWTAADPNRSAVNSRLYIGNVWLGQMLKPGTKVQVLGRSILINSLGYRGKEFTLEKPAGTRRLVCLGGSTTFDVKVSDDAHAWPGQLERLITARGAKGVQVINAGTNGYALSRTLIDLALRTVDLRPDWIICYPGVNDVGYADRVDYQYGECHRAVPKSKSAEVEWPWQSWISYSAMYQEVTASLLYRRQKKFGNWEGREIARHDEPDPRGMAAMERNLITLVGICQAHDIKLGLVTVRVAYDRSQSLDERSRLAKADLMDHPGLSIEGHLRGYEMANELIRTTADRYDLLLLDQARELPTGESYFADSVHFNDTGALQFAEFVDTRTARWLNIEAPDQTAYLGGGSR